MLPSSSELKYFIEVAKTGNITQAARLLGITQPTLTLAMKRLEAALAAELFIRTKKGIFLTQEGKVLLREAKTLLSLWESIENEVRDNQSLVKGKVSLGLHHSVALYTLPLFMPSLLKRHPQLEVELTHDLSRKITEKVVGLDLDVGVVINPIRHPDLIMIKLGQDEVSLYSAAKKHAPRLICDPNMLQSQHILRKLSKGPWKNYPCISTSSLEVAAELCGQGLGMAILPGRVAAHQKQLGLVRVPHGPTFADEIFLIFRVEKKNHPGVAALAQELKQVFR